MATFNEYHSIREEYDTQTEILMFEQELFEWKKTHPGKDISKKKKSDLVKRARRGEDVFGGGKNFEKIEKSASKRYGSEEAGKRVAGAIMWKKAKGKHMTKEDVDDVIWIVEDDMEVILDHAIEEQQLFTEKKKNWIKGAIKHPGRCTPMSKPGCKGAARALAIRFKRGDIHQDNLEKDE